MQNNTKQPSRTFTDTSPTEELRRLPQSTRSEPSQEKAKDLGPEPGPEVRVRFVCKCETSHPPRECPVWGKKCHKCGNKNHFSMQCRVQTVGRIRQTFPQHIQRDTRTRANVSSLGREVTRRPKVHIA